MLEKEGLVKECFGHYRKQSLLRFELFGLQMDIDHLADTHALMQRGEVEGLLTGQCIGQDLSGINRVRGVMEKREYSLLTYGCDSAGQSVMHQKARDLGVSLEIEGLNAFVQ